MTKRQIEEALKAIEQVEPLTASFWQNADAIMSVLHKHMESIAVAVREADRYRQLDEAAKVYWLTGVEYAAPDPYELIEDTRDDPGEVYCVERAGTFERRFYALLPAEYDFAEVRIEAETYEKAEAAVKRELARQLNKMRQG